MGARRSRDDGNDPRGSRVVGRCRGEGALSPPLVRARVRTGAGTNRDAMRRHNLGTMLQHIHREGQLSRAALTGRLGLSRGAIGDLLAELESLGTVTIAPSAEARTSAGRPSPVVRPVPEHAQVLAAEVSADHLRVAAVGLGGTVLGRRDGVTPASHDPRAVVESLGDLATSMTAELPAGTALLGVGVAVPGMVAEEGLVRLAPSLGWTDVPLVAMLLERLSIDVPVAAANDADLGALAEHTRGAGLGHDHMVFVGCDDLGVGGGVIIDGRAFRGLGGYAGEFGHLFVNPVGRRCDCGSTGCWETEIGAARVAEALGLPTSDPAALAEALHGLSTPPEPLRTAGRFLGLGLASIVNAFNTGLVVLGGTLRDLYPVVRDETDAALDRAALPAPRAQMRLVLSELGSDAALIGAAEMMMEPLFTDPAGVLAAARRASSVGAGAPG
jgi:predicted NBD/HSP70 family sugar kinase